MRSFVLSFLAALTLATNLAAGVARGHASPKGLVICTGQGPVMVYLDEAGRPTAPPELCPDGVMLLFGAVSAPPPPAALQAGRIVHLFANPDHASRALAVWIDGRARAPPA